MRVARTHKQAIEQILESESYDIERGDLALLRTIHATKFGYSPVFGVFEDIETYKVKKKSDTEHFVLYYPAFRLHKPIHYNGVALPKASVNGGGSAFRLDHIFEIITGKERIIDYCNRNSLEAHAEWISLLEKPYHLPATTEIINVSKI